jgi:outer membrane protein OmpA-like peptidoglycan-associated protein
MKNTLCFTAGIIMSISPIPYLNAQVSPYEHSSAGHSRSGATMITRTVEAVNYQHRSGATKIDFAGTDMMPSASGQAKVESKKGYLEIEVEFQNFKAPTTFGTEYLTYILWAISPEGRAVNLGEVLVGSNHRGKLDVTTDLQAFALIVTAEPYFAVHQPSNAVVLENVVRADTKGTSEAVNAKYELMERGGYIPTGYKFDPVVLDANVPLEFLEARNAVRIAQSAGAEKYAGDSYAHATQLMGAADRYATEKHSPKKQLIATSREAVQTAEDARAIAVKNLDQERLADERKSSQDAQASLQMQADHAARLQRESEAESAKARADMAATQAAAAADVSAAQANAAADVAAAHAEADRARMAADAAQQSEQRVQNERLAMRAQLSQKLNEILQTRDSARGLIVSMSDVLFDSGKYSLKAGAREKLSKVAGILVAYPGLAIEVGGYTDSVGGDEMNQKLSENRASAVRDYVVTQGVATNSVTAKGFGNTSPVASNDVASGRQENRRVELVVSGDAIGVRPL